jgi:hypothetical protein
MTISVAVTHDLATGISKYTIAWVADIDGSVTGSWPMQAGFCWLAEHCPVSDPDAQYAELYNMTISNDADGADILAGTGVNISNAGPSFATPMAGAGAHPNQPVRVTGTVIMNVTGAGKGGAGTVTLFVGGFNRFSPREDRPAITDMVLRA